MKAFQPRYIIMVTFSGRGHSPYGTAETLHGALVLVREALERGATYACQHDTRQDEPQPVTDAEREAMAGMEKHVVRNFG